MKALKLLFFRTTNGCSSRREPHLQKQTFNFHVNKTTKSQTGGNDTTGAAGVETTAAGNAGTTKQSGTTEPPTTNAPTTTGAPTTAEPTTTEGVTTPYVTTVIPYPGITVNECVGECDELGFMYASLYNGSYCICHNSMADLDVEYDDEANCDIECKGGNDYGGGLICGGEGYVSVYQGNFLGM